MIVVTSDTIQGKAVTRTLGLCRGNTAIGKDDTWSPPSP